MTDQRQQPSVSMSTSVSTSTPPRPSRVSKSGPPPVPHPVRVAGREGVLTDMLVRVRTLRESFRSRRSTADGRFCPDIPLNRRPGLFSTSLAKLLPPLARTAYHIDGLLVSPHWVGPNSLW